MESVMRINLLIYYTGGEKDNLVAKIDLIAKTKN
jgi:hypothetical protein